jgi:hypothetical protein
VDERPIEIDDIVEWTTMAGDKERGRVVEIRDGKILLDYGPWSDSFWAPSAELRRVNDRPNNTRKTT